MKICILGGGTAGWLAALYIKKRQPEHSITVVDSSRIGIIGTGEGSTGLFADTIHKRLGIGTIDFLANTGATQKLGNRFHNWRGDGRAFIAPLDNTETSFGILDSTLLYHCKTGKADQAHLTTECGRLADQGLTSFSSDAQRLMHVHSYHFDGHQVGAYFKKLSTEQGTRHIDAEFSHLTQSETGSITSITLNTGEIVEADIFVDASGFARLLGPAVGAGWHSYSDSLTCDRAMPFQLPHLDRIDALTEAHALSAGWMWQIPVQQRRGCGYVFDSDFITPDQAQQEIETVLGHPIDPIKIIKFDSGRVEHTFSHNVVSLGLAGNFLEPLQATNLHGTITQLWCMTEMWLRPWGVAGPRETKNINDIITRSFDMFADLIQTHYHGGRSDTEFWRYQQTVPERPRLTLLREIGQHRWPVQADWGAPQVGGSGYGVSIYPMLEYGWLAGAIEQEQLSQSQIDRYHQEMAKLDLLEGAAMNNTVLVNRLRRYGGVHEPVSAQLPTDLRRLLELGR
jgi:tryptophan halogenase